MGQTEVSILIILTGVIVLVFAAGLILFLFHYRKKQLEYQKEKGQLQEQHQLDILNTQLDSQRLTMQYIGQEIHDSVAQKLTLASIYTQRMEFETPLPAEKDKLSGIGKILNDSLLELRKLSKSLTDNKLQDSSLTELIQGECEQINATGICLAVMKSEEIPGVDIATKSSLLRIVQEFTQNSIKHAACKTISITINRMEEELAILISDDGKGFDVEKMQSQGIGLDGIRRRIQLLKGVYKFESNAGQGTSLRLSVPCTKQ